MKIDTTISLALIISLSTIIVPVIATVLNRRYDLKLKQIDYKRESLKTNRSQTLVTFQEFVVATGKILTRIDTSQIPSREEMQTFESSCLKCLLFLKEDDRQEFQQFRILVKLRFGHKDPRGSVTSNFLMTETLIKVTKSLQKSLGIEPSDDVYASFNRCITIANNYLELFESQEMQVLTEQGIGSKSKNHIRSLLQRRKNKDIQE
ncbi:hypothetical protein MX629_08385 [Carnobacterium divergens]|uniref:DUF4760 domain-containing protein n=1 Tax=Carnobacterium divergens TaxID=2748 RepID=A0AAW8R9G7_CARDV|nr:hypothetical protein [Carnobacterium divergens]MDT1958436.1 hypothetical protein [Carnobacterium divergens]MDT1974404.1 hypothetical protein [Carnobacterium divergens]